MMIETTFMRYGKGPRGMIGITLKSETLKTWAFSLHTGSLVSNDISNMTSNEKATLIVHKEELNGRIRSDGVDREKIRNKLEAIIDPLNPASHPSGGIINVISGKNTVSVNVDQALTIGEEQMKKFENSWQEGFHSNIPKQVQTLAVDRKQIQVESAKIYDTNLIYSRLIGLQASGREA